METADILNKARAMFLKDYADVLGSNGILPPSKNKDPVNPPWSVNEYEAMEKDNAKYFLYYAAIFSELQFIKKCLNEKTINGMVVGAGRGRLVDYFLDSTQELGMSAIIYVAECNSSANDFLRDRYKEKDNVIVLPPFLVRTTEELCLAADMDLINERVKSLLQDKSIDLFISELLGSFGDNECMQEIMSACKNAFGSSDSVSLPRSYSTYICAIQSQVLKNYFQVNCPDSMYILGLPDDTVILSEITEVYSSVCTVLKREMVAFLKLKLFKNTTREITGLAGYFRAHLGNGIVIDTTPTESRNTFFWETAFFPFAKPVEISEMEENLRIKFIRNSEMLTLNSEKIFDVAEPLIKVLYKWLYCTRKTHEDFFCGGNHVIRL